MTMDAPAISHGRATCPHCGHTWKPRKRFYSQGSSAGETSRSTGQDVQPIYCPQCKRDLRLAREE